MVKMDLPPLRYPQPVGAAWEPKSFNDSFDFFNIDFLESFFSQSSFVYIYKTGKRGISFIPNYRFAVIQYSGCNR